MPIKIYNSINNQEVDYLCHDSWDLPEQFAQLEEWLGKKGHRITPSKYIADIGFEIRKDSTGGGAILKSSLMKTMAEIGMDVYFSEYSNLH